MDADQFKDLMKDIHESGLKVVCTSSDLEGFNAHSDTYTVGLFTHPKVGAELLFTNWFDAADAARIAAYLSRRAEDYPEFPISVATEIDMGQWALRFEPIAAPEDGGTAYPLHECKLAADFYGRRPPLLKVTKI